MRHRAIVLAALVSIACHGEDRVETCNDGVDNDKNGLVDCADPACTVGTSCGPFGLTCSADKTCTACNGNGGVGESVEETCGDGFDNDCDGVVDCGDRDCQAKPGGVGKLCDSIGHTCGQREASGSASCNGCPGGQITETSCGDNVDNDCDGLADCADDDCACTGPAPTGPQSVTMSATRVRLPADGSATSVVAAVVRSEGLPVAGARCTFSRNGGSGTLDASALPVTKTTDSSGRASVVFKAGLAAGTAEITASCAVGSQTPVTGTIALVLPALAHIRLVGAEHDVLGALGSGYHEQSLIEFELTADDGQPYPAGLRVDFEHSSQGGTFLGVTKTCSAGFPPLCRDYDTTDENGRATVLLNSGTRFAVVSVKATATAGFTRTLSAGGFSIVGAKPNGARISVDCTPYNIPAFTVHDCLYSHYATNDVQCTVTLADRHGITIGVPTLAAFQSEAGNAGAPAFTPAYDPRAATQSKTLGSAKVPLYVYNAPLPKDVDPFPGELSVDVDPAASLGWHCGTKQGNPRDGFVSVIAMVAGEEGFVDLNLNGLYDVGEPFIDLGEPFVDADDDGQAGPGEWFLDLDEDGQWTPPNGAWDANTVLWTQTRVVYSGFPSPVYSDFYPLDAPFPGLPIPAAYVPREFSVSDGPPPTSDFFGVFITDDNLNPMSSFTTFGAHPRAGSVTANLSTPSNTADTAATLGHFRLLYCDAPTLPANCRYGVADDACRTSPCYVLPEVGNCISDGCSGFTYGNQAALTVTGARPGPDVVDLSVTIDQVTAAPIALPGYCSD